MLVKKGDILLRGGFTYEVICCDEEYFIIGEREYIYEEQCMRTSFEKLEAYSNDETVNTLSDLKFTKRIKPVSWVD